MTGARTRKTTEPKSKTKKGPAPGQGAALSSSEITALVEGTHGDPFAVLGVHPGEKGLLARCFIPHAETVSAHTLAGKEVGQLTRLHDEGLFEGRLSIRKRQPLVYHAANAGGEWRVTDPYSFGPVLGEMDDYLIGEGSHTRLFDKMGAHHIDHEGATGMHFAVWAPNARRVSVVGDFDEWDGRRHVMRARRDTGIWEIFVPDIGPGHAYKFEIVGPGGNLMALKADPFAFRAEMRPDTSSITTGPLRHKWGDEAHREHWRQADFRRQPVSVYEVHAGSWRLKEDDGFLTWDELNEQLIPYVLDMGYTHIEFLPVSEHPYDPSWGYQTTGLYAPSARFGEPEGMARFVDAAHQCGIGVILDWVPAHFPLDPHSLSYFDGTALYEHADPRQGYHPDWNTAIYNFGRKEVRSYLVNNALFWAECYHVDGLRVDAVASMLYLDYSRKAGEWIPNREGGRENLEAIEFLQSMNREVYGQHPGVVTIAEESTSWPGVSKPVHEGGLGFGFKWNMGFMHDTLEYLQEDPLYRKHHHDKITFGLVYAFSENFVLPLSHDEVVHGKGTLLNKMPGDDWRKFANLRAYYGFMWGYPGKKLLFMGQEFAQIREWSEARGLDWHLLGEERHVGMRNLVKDLNHLYRGTPALYARDCEPEGFEWLIGDDAENSVFAWQRKAPGEEPVVVVTNFTPNVHERYTVPMPAEGWWREVMNTDASAYGGSGVGNGDGVQAEAGSGGRACATITIPPLATIMLKRNT
ncbi:1,4-alpha-glucan branching protein GlgB [Pararhizobium mangrovi]|uniref:1,4-alpha-glucan branching enzyme GlgB n=1 Tax=Pararhizobium mangrovi TaxID=2590452 RepID=A0A506U986_9HYPH|nr:1,4-alpha-glucan branching protein GlgB [Pararhizobium mangrovi]TPW29926.1 1,4-alpha-glucan branching protein GlgB [Pararhizobium mangrovi]